MKPFHITRHLNRRQKAARFNFNVMPINMNSKLLTITAALNIIILVISVVYYYRISNPNNTTATEMALKINPLPEGAVREFNNRTEKDKKETFELITSLYNRLTTYVTSQKNYYEIAIKSLTQNLFILFMLLVINCILLLYIVITNRHNNAFKPTPKSGAV